MDQAGVLNHPESGRYFLSSQTSCGSLFCSVFGFIFEHPRQILPLRLKTRVASIRVSQHLLPPRASLSASWGLKIQEKNMKIRLDPYFPWYGNYCIALQKLLPKTVFMDATKII